MKNTNIKKIICIAAVILIAVPVLTHNPLYFRLYPGNRIKASVQVFVDGEIYSVDDSNFKFQDNKTDKDTDHQLKVHVNSKNNAEVKIRANKKESYSFDIVDTPVNKPITIGYSKGNWWDIHRTDIKIDIDTSSETLTISANDKEIENNEILLRTSEKTETINYSQDDCIISFGP